MKREHLARALPDAHLPSLLLSLVHVTGDRSLLAAPFDKAAHLFDVGDNEAATRLRAHAADALAAATDLTGNVRDSGLLEAMLAFVSSPATARRYVPYARDVLLVQAAASAIQRQRKVVIVGAGLSGLLMAIRLQQAGYDFEIVEKNAGVGGTWFENVYPGCRVDTPGTLYAYASPEAHAWRDVYPRRDELHAYYRALVERHGLSGRIRFGTTLISAVFDEGAAQWRFRARDRNGVVALVADILISATGQLNEPSIPVIEGQRSFAGPAFHSARWPRDLAIDGKRVAVIGTGASAYQIVPEIAPRVASLSVFQRSAPWPMATPDYRESVPAGHAWLASHVPAYRHWYRLLALVKMAESGFASVVADPAWQGPPTAVSAANARTRVMLVAGIRRQFADAGALFESAVPQYPFGAKRPLRDDGAWLAALQRSNTALVTSPIAGILPHGVVTADGHEHPADILVYATGFRTGTFMANAEVMGRRGLSLQQAWEGDARAFLGVTVPGFPNLFFLYGPNTNTVVNGSTTFMTECASDYILACLSLLDDRGARWIEPSEESYARFNREIDEANRLRAWGVEGVSSWYKNAKGRVTQNWPFSVMDYWSRTRNAEPEDHVLGS